MRYGFLLLVFLFIACQSDQNTATSSSKKQGAEKTINQHEISQSKASDSNDFDPVRWSTYDYREENWNPKEGKYFFSEQWTWTYENQMIEKGEFGHKGEMSVFVDPPTGIMLFTREESNWSDDMAEKAIVFPDGKYILCYGSESGISRALNGVSYKSQTVKANAAERSSTFNKFFQPTGKTKVFGENQYSWPTATGTEYESSFIKTIDKSQTFYTQLPIPLDALYFINYLSDDLRTPLNVHIPLADQLQVFERYENNGKVYQMELKSMSNAEVHFDISNYIQGDKL